MARLHRPPAASRPAPAQDDAASPAVAPGAGATLATSHLRPRRSPRLVAAGVMLACLGGLGGALAYQQASHANQVVVVTHTVPRGSTLTSADLAVVTIGPAPGVHTIGGQHLGELVGQQALVDLPGGSLLGQESVGRVELRAGTAQVGLRLGAGRIPNQAMPPGTPVQLVEVGTDKSSTDAQPVAGVVVDATLVTAPQVLPDGSSRVVDVAVPAQQAQRVADLAARDRLTVVRKAGG